MKKILGYTGTALHRAIFCVGVFTIVDWASAGHPVATKWGMAVSTVVFICGFLWTIAVKPFREGLRER